MSPLNALQPEAPIDPRAIAVIVVNWNGWQNTLNCLDALRRSADVQWHLFIVDNASTDGLPARLRDSGADVTLILSPVNGGWSGGNNLGVRRALDAGYRLIFLLNNDAFVEPDTLRLLLEAKGLTEGGPVMGPIHLDGNGREFDFVGTDIDAATGYPVWKSVERDAVVLLPDLIETSFIKGAGLLADAEHFDRIGLFNDKFYLNFDETDWCYRARQAGFPLLMVKGARVRHIGSATIGGGASPMQAYFLARNALLFGEKHCSLAQRWRYLRRLYWEARDLPRANPSRSGWIWRFLRSTDDVDAAFRRGLIDYLLRRFGDCPPIIRVWNQAKHRIRS